MKAIAWSCLWRLGHWSRLMAVILVGSVIGGSVGAATRQAYDWPYAVKSVDVEPEPAASAGGWAAITTVRSYLQDCEFTFSRQIESVTEPRHEPEELPVERRTHTPWSLNNKPDTFRFAIPAGFPCGSAQLRTQPKAACNLFQRWLVPMSTRDVLTPFEIACN